MEHAEAAQRIAVALSAVYYAQSRRVPVVGIDHRHIELSDLSLAILVVAEQLIADRKRSARLPEREQRRSCFQGDLEALVIEWWDREQAGTKLSRPLRQLQTLGLLEPTIVKQDRRLRAWQVTDAGREYLRNLRNERKRSL